ncbi:ATP-binding protein [Streptomyces sp. NPDC087420]|uniref:sensor histidine kinase n=1 Tax=Streptomyces sp. NPDC087420 TaxID=3365785 RepID=UPI003838CEC9
MSQLRAPAARPDRREGGRHGRPGARSLPSPGRQNRPAPPDARIRPQLLRTAVLPAIIAALSGAAAVVLTFRSTAAEPTTEVWAALFGTALVAFAAVAAAALGAERTARSLIDRCNALRRSSARGQADLRAVVEQLRRGERVPPRRTPPPAVVGGDEFDLLAEELRRSQETAVTTVVQASRLSSSVGNEQKVEVFVNLARRLQSLVHREIQLLDDLENEVEDPELLKGLFHVDHLATRIRRHAENLAVLGGAISRRQWSKPVTMTEVLRSAIAEVEQYPRIKLVPPIDGTLRGHAVADVIHLLAELVENATLFSAPHTQVLLRVQYVTAGLAIEVEDRGLGMATDERKKMNGLLADPDQVNVAHLLQDGRIGLFVVSALARRHGIAVRLQSNIYGGIQAVLVLPQALLGADPSGLDGRAGAGGAGASSGAGSGVAGTVPDLRSAPAPVPPPPAAAPAPSPVPQARHRTYEVPPRPSHRAAGTGAPAPLPVRGERPDRPTPAAARPGVTHPRPQPAGGADPSATPSGARIAPRVLTYPSSEPAADGTLHSTASRPQLPRRRGQEHLVPQLRDRPAPAPAAEPVLHDPGLMAAFQRGIDLAESQPLRDSGPDTLPDTLPDPLPDPLSDPLPAPLRGPLPGLSSDPLPDPLSAPLPDPLSDPLPEQPEPQRHDTTSKE